MSTRLNSNGICWYPCRGKAYIKFQRLAIDRHIFLEIPMQFQLTNLSSLLRLSNRHKHSPSQQHPQQRIKKKTNPSKQEGKIRPSYILRQPAGVAHHSSVPTEHQSYQKHHWDSQNWHSCFFKGKGGNSPLKTIASLLIHYLTMAKHLIALIWVVND